jgi:hypothetical protein
MSEPPHNDPETEKMIYWLIVFVIGGVVLAMAVTFSIKKPRATSSANACVNNLRQIDAAASQFALENHLTNGAPIHFPDDLTPYIKLNSAGKIPECPHGGIYTLTKVGDTPICSLGSTITPPHIMP